jgi:hypothetical protein
MNGIEIEVRSLEGTAYWRRLKAIEYTNDKRNESAAALLHSLEVQVEALDRSPIGISFCQFHDVIFTGDDLNQPEKVSQLWSDYRNDIGFRNFPNDGEGYLEQLMEIAKAAS